MTEHRVKSQTATDRDNLQQIVQVSSTWAVKLHGNLPVDAREQSHPVSLAHNDELTIGVDDGASSVTLDMFSVQFQIDGNNIGTQVRIDHPNFATVTLTQQGSSRTIKVKVVTESDLEPPPKLAAPGNPAREKRTDEAPVRTNRA